MPFLKDNLGYILLWVPTGKYCLVDPADFDAIHDALKLYGIQGAPEAILTTHKHWDHAGHNANFAAAYDGVRIISGLYENVYASNENIDDEQTIKLLDGNINVSAISSSSHTSGHMMYMISFENQAFGPLLFTGDCIFEGGVGMFFEGTPNHMQSILWKMFFQMELDPTKTTLFYGHDYGWKNIRWVKESIFAENKITPDTEPEILELKKKIDAKCDSLMVLRDT